jgi:hypothetical protein
MTFGYRFESGDGLRRYLGESRRSVTGHPNAPYAPHANFGASRSQLPSSLFKNPWATALICPHPILRPSRKVHGYRLRQKNLGVGPLGTVTAVYART